MSNPIGLAAGAKGRLALLNRIRMIAARYGLTPAKMERALNRFAGILRQFDCGATFPVTAVAVARHPDVLTGYQAQGIEFAVHGYTHVDYSQLTAEEQVTHLHRAREIMAHVGIMAAGFRSPYLQYDANLHAAVEAAGFSYVSNQPIMWDVLAPDDMDTIVAFTPATDATYRRALAFYAPWSADERLSLPRLEGDLVEIPVSLPDDEILLDRLRGSADLIEKVWRKILLRTHRQGELFTLQLHPERVALCADGLVAVLSEARTLDPPVWLARLDEIAAWWKARAAARVEITAAGDSKWHVVVDGPGGLTTSVQGQPNGYHRTNEMTFEVRSPRRPCVGLSPDVAPELADFVRQQGYIVETGGESDHFSCYLNQSAVSTGSERSLLAQIEEADHPLVRLERWPDGARSALAITGDIDALTLWDYAARLVGR